jgi:hypothetical protein
MMIGVIDFGIEKIFHRPNIIYDWHECITITLIIELTLLPIIIKRKVSNSIEKTSFKG